MRLLQSEGFIFSGTIDLFDGGPIMSVHRDTIRAIMDSETSQMVASPSGAQGKPTLIASGKVNDFRAVLAPAKLSEHGLLVLPDVFKVLGVDQASPIRFWQAPPKFDATQPTLVKAHI